VDQMNSSTGDLRVDRMIDDVLARQAAGRDRGEPASARLSSDEALVAELLALGEIDWPADEVGDRVTQCVAAAGQRPASGRRVAGPPARDRQPGARRLRSGRPRWLAAGAGAAAVALVAVAVQFGGLHGAVQHGQGPGTAGRTSPRPTPPVAQTPGATPASLTAMTVVGSSRALNAVGGVANGSDFLTCVTRLVCYIVGERDNGLRPDIARSLNGGATWTAGETLPAHTFEWNAGLTCPTAQTCFSAFGTGLLETSDGFAHYRLQPVTLPVGLSDQQVEQVACPTARQCVADVLLTGSKQAFFYSDDAGATWAAASAPAFSVADEVQQMRCAQGGACIAGVTGGTESDPTVAALSSADGGRSWAMSPARSLPNLQTSTVACGNARNCLVGGGNGTDHLGWIHVTATGRISIRVQAFPKRWAATGVTVSCATGRDCFVETTNSGGAATIEATRNGGLTWRSLGTPMAPAVPGDEAAFLSCPVAAGCIAIANDPAGSQPTWVVLSNLHRDG
jgi:hypothetical protein